MATTTDLTTLKINYLTQAQYDAAKEDGDINEDEIYLTPGGSEIILSTTGTTLHIDSEPLAASVVDYVVEEGTSGIWTYRKWASGRYECVGYTTATVSVSTSSGSIYRSSLAYTMTLPFTPTSILYGDIRPNTSSYMMWSAMISFDASNSLMTCYFLSSSSFSDLSINIRAYAMGMWK